MIGRENEQKVLTEKNSLNRYQSGYSGSASLLAHNLKATSDKVKLLLTIMKEYEYNL
jgi:hypothetical protein